MSVEEVLKWMENSVREVDVIVKLAFCGKVSSLGCQTTNKQMAEARLQSVKRKLQRDEKFHIQYRQFMENVIDSGYARTLTEEEPA